MLQSKFDNDLYSNEQVHCRESFTARAVELINQSSKRHVYQFSAGPTSQPNINISE